MQDWTRLSGLRRSKSSIWISRDAGGCRYNEGYTSCQPNPPILWLFRSTKPCGSLAFRGRSCTDALLLATFARSMASTVRFFIRNGGDVRGLDIPTITKNGLRAMVQPENPIVGGTRAERAFLRNAEGVTKAVAAMARGDPEAARERLRRGYRCR